LSTLPESVFQKNSCTSTKSIFSRQLTIAEIKTEAPDGGDDADGHDFQVDEAYDVVGTGDTAVVPQGLPDQVIVLKLVL